MNYIYKSYKIIDEVLRKEAYSTIYLNKVLALSTDQDKKLITKIVYGVLENNILLEYKISQLCQKKPKNSVYNLLKVGIYLIDDMDGTKNHAAVKETVQIAKAITKNSLTGFVNATLKKAIDFEYTYPTDKKQAISVKYSYPMWFVEKMIADFGEERAEEILQFQEKQLVSIRVRGGEVEKFGKLLSQKNIQHEIREGSLFAKYREINASDIPKNLYVKQSRSSMFCVEAFGVESGDEILDMCASPGGKACFMAELAKSGSVVACDIHPHRVKLLQSYFARMKTTNAVAMQKDGVVFEREWENKFSKVLVDAPCSALGVVSNKPEIKLQKTQDNILGLAKLQKQLLENGSKYLKSGGEIIYSTCTVTKEENNQVVEAFLAENKDFSICEIDTSKLEKYEDTGYGIQIFPSKSFDGFFVCKLKKG